MINLLAYCLISKIVKANCDIFSCNNHKFIGRQNSHGHVLYGDKYMEYIGLTDKIGNYFYLRYAKGSNDNSFNKISRVDSSLENYRVVTPLKMVVVFKDLSPELFHYKLLNDLVSIDMNSFDERGKPFIEPVASTTDFEAIFKEETLQEIKNWNGNIRLISFDLNLVYNIDQDECQNLPDLCTDISYDQFLKLQLEADTLEDIIEKAKQLAA